MAGSGVLPDLLSASLGRGGADEKPWSATRLVGETHRAGGRCASFTSVSKSLQTTVGGFGFPSRWTSSFPPSVRNLLGEVRERENSLGVTSSFQRRRGEERGKKRKERRENTKQTPKWRRGMLYVVWGISCSFGEHVAVTRCVKSQIFSTSRAVARNSYFSLRSLLVELRFL